MMLQRESEEECERESGCASVGKGETERAHRLHQGNPEEYSKRDLSLLPAFASRKSSI